MQPIIDMINRSYASLKQKLADTQGAMAADGERLRLAAERVGIVAGCDAPGEMADMIESLRQQLADVTKEIGRLRHDLEIAHEHRRFAERECDRLQAELIMSEARRELVTAAYDKAFKIVEVGPNAVAKREDKKLSESARTLQELQGIIEKLRAELLQRELQLVPDLDWLRASFGEPVEKHGGGYLEWHPQMIVFDTHYNNTFRISEHGGYIPGRLPTRAAVLAAVAATKGVT